MDIGCTIRQLPADQHEDAARLAAAINPANALPALARAILPPARIALLTSKYWGAKVDLGVTFLESTAADLKAKILAYANKWARYGNIRFRESAAGEVRISRGAGGYWSYLGTDILSVPRNEQTMNLEAFSASTPDSEFDRVVCHEFGHVLGYVHEHMRPDLVARLDEAKTLAYFERTQGWSEQEVRQQVLTPLSEASLMGTPVDQDSIMCYQLPGSITKDGKPIRGGLVIEATDGAFTAKAYPPAVVPPPPPPPTLPARVVHGGWRSEDAQVGFTATFAEGSTVPVLSNVTGTRTK